MPDEPPLPEEPPPPDESDPPEEVEGVVAGVGVVELDDPEEPDEVELESPFLEEP